ncbi:hypothetical protein HPB50_008752 [Hyalomma asiaticum]|uniref:Uncharacterized protein n=1 Tax=Hyalomma asiaticum TaxID=266040 RepID=A0ACB7TB68_HYAAI|nr:hypothetical protein HPB50_008752 [Hyalomma asiaticum]
MWSLTWRDAVSQQQQLSTILVPIICSVFALVIVALGIAYHMHTRNQLRIEVADFDFNEPPTDDLVEKTFTDRLRSALLQALVGSAEDHAEAESNGSPTASNIRHPVAASREELHLVRRSYGTIA